MAGTEVTVATLRYTTRVPIITLTNGTRWFRIGGVMCGVSEGVEPGKLVAIDDGDLVFKMLRNRRDFEAVAKLLGYSKGAE